MLESLLSLLRLTERTPPVSDLQKDNITLTAPQLPCYNIYRVDSLLFRSICQMIYGVYCAFLSCSQYTYTVLTNKDCYIPTTQRMAGLSASDVGRRTVRLTM